MNDEIQMLIFTLYVLNDMLRFVLSSTYEILRSAGAYFKLFFIQMSKV